jgi:hypothetical protein
MFYIIIDLQPKHVLFSGLIKTTQQNYFIFFLPLAFLLLNVGKTSLDSGTEFLISSLSKVRK